MKDANLQPKLTLEKKFGHTIASECARRTLLLPCSIMAAPIMAKSGLANSGEAMAMGGVDLNGDGVVAGGAADLPDAVRGGGEKRAALQRLQQRGLRLMFHVPFPVALGRNYTTNCPLL